MKTKSVHRKPVSIAKGRWAAYATAGAASAFTCANSAKATIHYSGLIHEFFGSECDKSASFQLDQPGDSFRLRHLLNFCGTDSYGGFAYFSIRGRAENAVAGFYNPCPSAQVASASKLNRGQLISRRPFLARNSGVLAAFELYCSSTGSVGQFDSGGIGFIGFKFNNGSGDQYGWVRVKMATRFPTDHDFWLVDYAYADPGEPIRAGQMSSNEMVPEEGSLGWLAVGAVGLMAWRKSRSLTARLKDA
jgi:hypothetical protein